jgi:ankyrin repeat protein
MMRAYIKRNLSAAFLGQLLLLPYIAYAEPPSHPVGDVNVSEMVENPANPQANHQLLEAVKSNDADKLQQALQEGADVNNKFKKGRTALFKAIKNNDREIIELLIQNGADVHAKDEAGNTPLIYAVKKEKMIPVQLLLHYGADPHEQNNSGKNAIDIAKSDELREILDALKEIELSRSSLGLFVELEGKELTLDRFRVAAIKAFEARNWQNIDSNNNQVSGIYEKRSRIFKSTMIYEPNLVIIKFETAMGYRKPYYLESLRAVFLSELEKQ